MKEKDKEVEAAWKDLYGVFYDYVECKEAQVIVDAIERLIDAKIAESKKGEPSA